MNEPTRFHCACRRRGGRVAARGARAAAQAHAGHRRGESYETSRDRRHVMHSTQSRRRFLTTLSSAGAAGLIGARNSQAQEGLLETITVRLAKIAGICIAPQYVADELLQAEGFTDIRYVATDAGVPDALSLARGEVDFTVNFAPAFIIPIDAGEAITIVGGEHISCFELFAREGIRSISD